MTLYIIYNRSKLTIGNRVPNYIIGPADPILYVLLVCRSEHRHIIVFLETGERNCAINISHKIDNYTGEMTN